MPGIADRNQLWAWLQAAAIGRNPRQTLKRLAVLLGLALVLFLILKFILLPVQITGPSMQPTYHNGQINFINRLAYWRSEPQRGDVVGVRFAGHSVMLFKRIVGLPGETVAFERGRILINGRPLDEPYVKFSNNAWDFRPLQLGPNDYYFVGDNRSMPFEDHEKGAASRSRILGKVLLGPDSGEER